jgi:Domain of unknown function (DUF5916)/Carbohydrate family 9 binding domain-like
LRANINMLKAILTISAVLCFGLGGFGQAKQSIASKISSPPRMDGSLDEDVWKNASAASGFITNTPSYGKHATDSTIVKVLYDNTAVYIGAYLYANPADIRKQFTPRDQDRLANADHFGVFIDSYNDKQNAYQFLVTARNVQSDARVSANIVPEQGVYGDISWDAVWDSKVMMQTDGWTVEIRIPLYSIRFSNHPEQFWGVQFLRFSAAHNETSFWNPVNPNTSGFVNQFGLLDGVGDLTPTLRLSFSPYVSGGYRGTPSPNKSYQNEVLKTGGMDVKYGLSESFTLDATLIPDFGQVVSDNVINNISPFEIQFRENRQFFTEGTELFNKAEMFYSRRIGREPGGYRGVEDSIASGRFMNYDILRNPAVTRLYNAIKFSGRTNDNLGIGVFNAVTQPEIAVIRNSATRKDSVIGTEALTNYNVIVVDQALKNRSYITFTNTNVLRNGHERDANVTGLDLALYDKKNRYGLLLKPRYSKIYGNGGYDGFKNYLEIGKVSGRFQWALSNDTKSDKYDPNDLGFQLSPNEVLNKLLLSYNIYEPDNWFLNQQYTLSGTQSYLYKPFEYGKSELIFTTNWTLKNLWNLQIETGTAPSWFNDFFELQTPSSIFATPRKKLRRAPYYYFFTSGNTDSRRRLYVDWATGYAEGPLPDDPFYKLLIEARYRFSDRFTMTASYSRQYDKGQFGYSFLRDPVTQEPILARRQYTDVTSVLSGIYNFTPRMNITFRARHFWNRILNTDLFNVQEDGNWVKRTDFPASSQNINYNAFNLDVFYTWDFRLGSRIIFAWKNSLGTDYEDYINGTLYNRYLSNASRLLQTPHGNEFTIRFIYFLDYQQLRRRK